jgi:hypothetical protein
MEILGLKKTTNKKADLTIVKSAFFYANAKKVLLK